MTPQEIAKDEVLLTCADIARLLQVTPATVADWCSSGKLPATRPAKAWMVEPEDYRAFKARHSNQRVESAEDVA